MRPDEHKKKKNETYKKKHGMSKEKNKDEAKGKGKELSKKNNGNERSDHTKDKDRNLNKCSSSSSESEVEEKYTPKKKNFQRRKLESNWDKYELGPDFGAEADPGGKSYRELLEASTAGAAMSHFRFQEELEWGQAREEEEEEEEMLAFDPAELAQCLSCLPTHIVLGLPENLFTAEELADSIKTAKENEAKYYPDLDYPVHQSIIPADKNVPLDTKSSANSAVCHEKQCFHKNEPEFLSANEKETQIKPKDTNSIETTIETIHTFEKKTEAIEEKKAICDREKSVLDSDLDSLLDMDSPAVTETHCDNKTEEIGKDGNKNTVKDCVENKESSRKSPSTSSPTQSLGCKAGAAQGTEQLEDWLDSILDD